MTAQHCISTDRNRYGTATATAENAARALLTRGSWTGFLLWQIISL
jgi:hypothetical protein